MSSIRLALCLAVLVVAVSSGRVPREDKKTYTTRFDNVNVDEILRSDRLLNVYIKCMLDKGKCTPDGLEIKKNLPDALNHGCDACTDKQRQVSEKVLRFLVKNKPTQFKQLEQKYDPNGSYRKKYDAEIKEYLEKNPLK